MKLIVLIFRTFLPETYVLLPIEITRIIYLRVHLHVNLLYYIVLEMLKLMKVDDSVISLGVLYVSPVVIIQSKLTAVLNLIQMVV